MSVVHPQHLAPGRIAVESAPRMETDKKGTFSSTARKLGPPKVKIFEVSTLLFFLDCAHGVAEFSLDQTSGILYTPGPQSLSPTQQSPAQSCVLSQAV